MIKTTMFNTTRSTKPLQGSKETKTASGDFTNYLDGLVNANFNKNEVSNEIKDVLKSTFEMVTFNTFNINTNSELENIQEQVNDVLNDTISNEEIMILQSNLLFKPETLKLLDKDLFNKLVETQVANLDEVGIEHTGSFQIIEEINEVLENEKVFFNLQHKDQMISKYKNDCLEKVVSEDVIDNKWSILTNDKNKITTPLYEQNVSDDNEGDAQPHVNENTSLIDTVENEYDFKTFGFVNKTEQSNQQQSSNFHVVTLPKLEQETKEWITQKAKILKNGESTEIKMFLRPAHLGKITLEVTMKDGVLATKIMTEHLNSKEVLEIAMPLLKETLQNQGFKIGSFDVSLMNQQQEKGQNFWFKRKNKKNYDKENIDIIENNFSNYQSANLVGIRQVGSSVEYMV